MFHNHFFLKRLAEELHERLQGALFLECFSQNKDELILGFDREQQEFFIRAHLDPSISLLQFPEAFSRAKKNSVDLFSRLINQKVCEVKVFSYERSFCIAFENQDALIFKMHDRRANILHATGDEIIDAFRKNLTQDFDIVPIELNKTVSISKQSLDENDADPLKLIPALGKEVKIWLEKIQFQLLTAEEKWMTFNELLQKLNQNPIFLIEANIPRISLIEEAVHHTNSAISATNWLYDKTSRVIYFEKEKEQTISHISQNIKKSESYIRKTRDKLMDLQTSRNPEEIANILMANLHQLQTGLSKAVLHDFYKEEPIIIKLNTSHSPQKNAENLYRKAKNRHQEINKLEENIRSKEKLIDQLSRQILHLQEIDSHKELRQFRKDVGLDRDVKKQPESLPYHEFEKDGWRILVGRNSRANDELTLKVASKNDLWLHAKDVAGSHVVVKERPGQNYPRHIIEYAASLAAANSKRKTDTLCPVIYTQKKHVRKSKGAPPGQVIVEKEEVVMIESAKD